MTDPRPEEWQYPVEHREAVRELLRQEHVLQARLRGSEERIKALRNRARFASTRLTWLGVGIALGAAVASFAGMNSTATALLAACGLLIVLIAMFVIARAYQHVDRITQAQDAETEINAALDDLMHDIHDLELWQTRVNVRILHALNQPLSAQTKKDYFILILGSAALFLLIASALL